MNGRNIPINKGNYTMETPEREALFEKSRGAGWEKEYSEYRKNWSAYPKTNHVSEFPLLVDLELSTICNLKCPMCYTISEEFKKKVHAGLMDFNLFTKIIDEIGGKVPAIRLSLRGEPTLHPHFLDCIRYAKEHGIKEVSTLTNGSMLSEVFFTKAMQAGLDWITISVDGLGDTYEAIRKPLKFLDTLEKIKKIKTIKELYKTRKPVIKVQAVWPSIKDNPTDYYDIFAPIVDLISYNPLIDYLGKDESIAYEDNFSCCQLYQRLVIAEDGLAMSCSNDEEGVMIVGDTNKETIHDIWHGAKLSCLREVHKEKDGFKQLPVCLKCYIPRLTDDLETSRINGREFVIKNYVLRPQAIGD